MIYLCWVLGGNYRRGVTYTCKNIYMCVSECLFFRPKVERKNNKKSFRLQKHFNKKRLYFERVILGGNLSLFFFKNPCMHFGLGPRRKRRSLIEGGKSLINLISKNRDMDHIHESIFSPWTGKKKTP